MGDFRHIVCICAKEEDIGKPSLYRSVYGKDLSVDDPVPFEETGECEMDVFHDHD